MLNLCCKLNIVFKFLWFIKLLKLFIVINLSDYKIKYIKNRFIKYMEY